MPRNVEVFILVAIVMLSGCSSGDQQSPYLQLVNSGGGELAPGAPAPWESYHSNHYLGPYVGSLMQVGNVKVDYRGCDGLVVTASSLCMALLVDGDRTVVDTIEHGSIVEFFLDMSKSDYAWVDVQHAAIGTVEDVDAAHARFTVLGQTVHVTDRTAQFGMIAQRGIADLDDLRVGDYVTISGYFSNGGEIVATLIQREAGPVTPLLRGVLALAAGGTFHIGKMQLDLSGASLEQFPGGTPLAGDTVLLVADREPRNDVLAVRTARFATRDYERAVEEHLTGFVTAVRSNADFDIGGSGWQSSACSECDALTTSGKLTAEGTFVSATQSVGGMAHLSLEWATTDTTALIGPVASVDVGTGALKVLGFTVQTSPATYLSADAQPRIGSPTFALADLGVGNTVIVRGGALGSMVVADRLAPTEGVDRIRMMTFALADPAIVFLGSNIQTDASTTVLSCESPDYVCTAADTTWLFGSAETPPRTLIVDVEAAGSVLRATRIEAFVN
jgi:Domain of unknown function (DUF5666)